MTYEIKRLRILNEDKLAVIVYKMRELEAEEMQETTHTT